MELQDTMKQAIGAIDGGAKAAALAVVDIADARPRLIGHGFKRRDESQQPLGELPPSGKFGRMFGHLRPLVLPEKELSKLDELADAMKEPDEAVNDPAADNPAVSAGFTYLGQFIDHDITFDPTSLQEVLIDPLALRNFRTPMLDLDSVYGAGPAAQPYLYQRSDPELFLIGRTSQNPGKGDATVPVSLPHDLPRSPEGFAPHRRSSKR